MSGAGAVLALFTALRELRCRTAVTGYLMCTDNMPSGTAMALGDVITIYGGTTVEVEDTDAEGRLIMADALALAAEEEPDAIIDVATLTGSALRALGPWVAALLGTSQALVDQVRTAAEVTGEHVWQMPLYQPYRGMLDSGVADLKNVAPIGWPDNIMASLFLATFVGDVPWAHVDICGPAQNNAERPWQPTGCSGFGARLLLQTVLDFKRP
jgi:leucyl aminopeptidase